MSDSESDESSRESMDESNKCNESDNKLTQYMLINKELSKSLVVLKAENARLRNHNKELNAEILNNCNELASKQNEIAKLRRNFQIIQKLHIQHMESLTGELQTYAEKLSSIYQGDNVLVDTADCENDITAQITEEFSNSNENLSQINDGNQPCVSLSLQSQKQSTRRTDILEENPSNLNTICEESEDENDTSGLEQISLVTSTHESTLTSDTTPESITIADVTIRATTETSVADVSEMGSMNSNKENEGPSTVHNENVTFSDEETSSAQQTIEILKTSTIEPTSPLKEKFITKRTRKRTAEQNSFNGPPTVHNENVTLSEEATSSVQQTNEIFKTSSKEPITPLKEKFITKRTQKRHVGQNSFEATNTSELVTSELVSSTPYKRKRSATCTDTIADTRNSSPGRSSGTNQLTLRSMTMSSGRPRRNVCPVNFVEPKLNSKMRRT